MKLRELCLLILIASDWLLVSLALADSPNELTAEERKQGFVSLFNGRDLDGWQHHGNWKVENGAIVCVKSYDNGTIGHPLEADDGTYFRKYWDIVSTAKVPQDFELCFEWKGIPGEKTAAMKRSFHLDDRTNQYLHGGTENGSWYLDYRTTRFLTGNREEDRRYWVRVGYFYCAEDYLIGLSSGDIPGPNNEQTAGTANLWDEDVTRPPGEWNQGRILWKGEECEHWLNGVIRLNRSIAKIPFSSDQTDDLLGTREVAKYVKRYAQRRDELHIEIRVDPYLVAENVHPVYFRGIKLRAIPTEDLSGTRWTTPSE